MKIIRKTKELKILLDSINSLSQSVGLVLTMGNIHAGHLALIKKAKNNNEVVVSGNTVLAFLNKETKRPVRCPDYMLEKVTPLFS